MWRKRVQIQRERGKRTETTIFFEKIVDMTEEERSEKLINRYILFFLLHACIALRSKKSSGLTFFTENE